MTDKVKVFVKGVHYDEAGGKEIIETISKGEYHIRNNTTYVVYEENKEETGFDSAMLKFDANYIKVIKKNKADGAEMKMEFEKGKFFETLYQMAGGGIKLGFKTTDYSLFSSENEEVITIKYEILMNGSFVSRNEMIIKIFSF